MEFSKRGSNFGALLVLFIFIVGTSAQITMSRQWIRGRYPGDDKEVESGRQTKSLSSKRVLTRYFRPPASDSEYFPVLVNAKTLEQLFKRINRKTSFGFIPVSSRNVASWHHRKA